MVSAVGLFSAIPACEPIFPTDSGLTEQLHCPGQLFQAAFSLSRASHSRTMDWGLASNMRADVAEPQLQIDSATEGTQGTDIDDSHISLLECEIEALSLNLEEEKKNTSRVRAECAKHLEELEDAERELLRCQTALKESGGKLAHAQVEMRDKNEDVIDAEEELMQCRVRVGELKQHIEDMAGQNQEKGIS